jgi:hypothetical protein
VRNRSEDALGKEKSIREELKREHEKTLWGDGYVHYLDCGDGILGIHRAKLTKLYTSNMSSLF